MCQYLKDYADHFHLKEHIELNSPVKSILRNDKTGKWQVTIETNGTPSTREFDKVVVSNGLVRRPIAPVFDDKHEMQTEAFAGTILSGRDYKS